MVDLGLLDSGAQSLGMDTQLVGDPKDWRLFAFEGVVAGAC